MKLHAGKESGNSYKLRILLNMLAVPYELIFVDLPNKEHKSPRFTALNPRGQVPVLEDGPVVIWDSSAALIYLARKYGRTDLLPEDPAGLAEVAQWLALAGNEIQFGLQYARRGVIRNRWIAGDLAQLQEIGRLGLKAMEQRLSGHEWLAGDRPTIADIACFPYVDTAPEALIDLSDYPATSAWLSRCKVLPGWIEKEVHASK